MSNKTPIGEWRKLAARIAKYKTASFLGLGHKAISFIANKDNDEQGVQVTTEYNTYTQDYIIRVVFFCRNHPTTSDGYKELSNLHLRMTKPNLEKAYQDLINSNAPDYHPDRTAA